MNQEKAISKKWIGILVGIVCIGTYVVNYYLRNMLSVATPELLLSGNYTETGIGLLSSVYMIFYAGGQLVNGFLGDMVPPRWMIFIGIGLGGGAIMAVPMAEFGGQSDYIMTIGGNFVCENKQVPCRLLLSPDVRSLNFLLRKLGVTSGD